MIPKRIYTTWISDKPMPAKFEPMLATWREKMPDYEIIVLGLGNIKHNPWVDAALAAGNNVLASNYARCQAVYETGGLYLDVDVEVLKSFDDLLHDACFVGSEEEKWLGCAVFGAEAGHPFLAECMRYIEGFDIASPQVENETGPRTFTELLRRRGWYRQRSVPLMFGDVKVYPRTYFYPYLYTETFSPSCVKPETYAIHHWAHSWNPVLKEPVSIIIPCYNQAEYLCEAIDSALAQTIQPHEIIVVDDGSKTGWVAALTAPYGDAVTTIVTPNRGVSAARNIGIRVATGKWIATLDADDRLAPEYIEKMIGKSDIVSAVIETFGSENRRWAPPKVNPTWQDFARQNHIMCCSLYKREIWKKIGGYDESMRDGYEDWDFWTRATYTGYGVHVVPETLFFYRKHPIDRAHIRGSVDGARVNDAILRTYMQDKWAALGIPAQPAAALRTAPLHYPVTLGVTVEYNGATYHKGTKIDHPLAVALKAAGLLTDPRIG